jgi:hypothetical protein
MSYRKTALAVLLACWLATPVAAYTIYLKDGNKILAKAGYKVEGENAIIILESGTQTFLALAEIDVERTAEANKGGAGGALIFEDGKFVERKAPSAPPPERDTVADLIDRGSATMRAPTRSATDPTAPLTIGGTPSGEQGQRQPMRNLELAGALKAAFAARGFERVPIYQGTEDQRPLVEMTADSEASVFHALEVAADVLLEVRAAQAESLSVMELQMTTGDQERAGQFAMTTEMAESLRNKEVELSTFFVRHVRF